MVSRTRLQKRSDRMARQLAKRTFRAFCFCVLVFLSITIALILLNPAGGQREGDVSVGLLMVLGRNKLFLPVTMPPKTPSSDAH